MNKKYIFYFILLLVSIYIWINLLFKLPSFFGILEWVFIWANFIAAIIEAFIPKKSKVMTTKIDIAVLAAFLINFAIYFIVIFIK